MDVPRKTFGVGLYDHGPWNDMSTRFGGPKMYGIHTPLALASASTPV